MSALSISIINAAPSPDDLSPWPRYQKCYRSHSGNKVSLQDDSIRSPRALNQLSFLRNLSAHGNIWLWARRPFCNCQECHLSSFHTLIVFVKLHFSPLYISEIVHRIDRFSILFHSKIHIGALNSIVSGHLSNCSKCFSCLKHIAFTAG